MIKSFVPLYIAKTLRALLLNSHSLLKKQGKNFYGKLRFTDNKQK